MIIIKHRINCISDLASVASEWGVEIDLRSDLSKPGRLHLSHDPWSQGDDFEAWLDEYCRLKISGPLILNTKEDGLEERVIKLLKERALENFFFLDTTVPTLARWTLRERERRFAVRLSRLEPVASVQGFVKDVDWIWLDCFGGEPHVPAELDRLRESLKVCLVSPELQGAPERLDEFTKLAARVDAVCTKFPERYLRKRTLTH